MVDRLGLRSFLLALVVAGVPTCDGDGKPDDKPDAKPDERAGAGKSEAGDGKAGGGKACDATVAKAIEQELLAGCDYSGKVLNIDAPLAPWKAAPSAPPDRTIRLEVTTEGTTVGWGPPVSAAQLPGRLGEELERAKRASEMSGAAMPQWGLVVAGDVPRAEVAAVLQVLVDAGQPRGFLILSTKDVGTPPAPRKPQMLAALHARVGKADPSERATEIAKEIKRTMPPCPGVMAVFQSVATVSPDQRCPPLAEGIAKGLVDCKCPDADDLLTLVYGVTVGTERPEQLSVASPVTLDPGAASRPGDTWAAVVGGLDPAALGALWVAPR